MRITTARAMPRPSCCQAATVASSSLTPPSRCWARPPRPRPGGCVGVLVQAREDTWLFWLLDNERTSQVASLPQSLRVKNLVQIHLFVTHLANTDRWRFFKAYCQVTGLERSVQKGLARQVIEKTRQREQERMSQISP